MRWKRDACEMGPAADSWPVSMLPKCVPPPLPVLCIRHPGGLVLVLGSPVQRTVHSSHQAIAVPAARAWFNS
jgi:hypothetical protein